MRVNAYLRQTYRIRYRGIDRKLRKIIKNEYRYLRSYECLRGSARLHQWTQHLRLLLLFHPAVTRRQRLLSLLSEVVCSPGTSALTLLRDSTKLQVVQALAAQV